MRVDIDAGHIGTGHKKTRMPVRFVKPGHACHNETMGKKSKSKKKPAVDPAIESVITRNRRAKNNYEILETLECGLRLAGSEVKSLRNGKVDIGDAFARIEKDELWLFNAEIAFYPQANVLNHEPRRPRKILVKKSELRKFAEAAEQKGLTLVPLDLHFKRGFAKVTLAVARGRKEHDNREKIKQEVDRREMQAALRRR